MKILIAEDDMICRSMVEDLLRDWGHEVVAAEDGNAAWQALQGSEAPSLAVLDWMMPGLDGDEVCRKIREQKRPVPPYLILLTGRQDKASIVAGLKAGADDYICKPFDPDELRARIDVGIRMLTLEQRLADRVRELEEALAHVKRLQGILPICSYCRKVRNDQNYWQQVESYLHDNAGVLFSHGICPECKPKVMAQMRRELGLPEVENPGS